MAAGHGPGQFDRVLIRLRAAEREKHLVQVAGHQLGQLLAQQRARFVRHEGIGIGELVGLALDRLDDARVTVAGVDAHQLAVEVDVALAIGGVEVDAPGVVDRDRIDSRLRRPLVKRVLSAEGDDFLAAEHVWAGARL